MTQNEMILDHLSKYDSITQLEAIKLYGIMRLASRISDLKKQKWPIHSITEETENRYGTKTRYSRYFLVKQQNAEGDA